MLVKLHANAATTPKMRAYIQASSQPAAALARELGISETTVRRWKKRREVADRASTPHTLATGFSGEEEAIAIELRTRLGLSLDDALEVMRRCLRADISRSALHRCLQRNGISQKHRDPKPAAQAFAPEPFGYVHIDLKHLPRLQSRSAYVFVAIERTTRFVHVEIAEERSGATIAACLQRFLEAFGHPVHTILTDNGAEFTDRFGDARWRRRDRGTGVHPFDQLCQHHGVRHKLARPYRPWTNGQVERMNRTLKEATVKRYYYETHDQLRSHLADFVSAYNFGRRLKTLRGLTPTNTSARHRQNSRIDSSSIQSIKCRD